MRIVGGRLRGRALATPKGNAVRPTSDRVREAIFNILEHSIEDFDLTGAAVLDLFAGTGALGIEAISRGAAQCVFVENSASSRALIQTNIEVLGLGGVGTIFRRSATDLGTASRNSAFSLVFADPPYGTGQGEAAITAAINGGWLADDAVIVLEEDAKSEVTWPAGCTEIDRRQYGGTQVLIARYAPSAEA
jgi:16S rRNA (guanine966-N2)-methyltransferase